MKNILIHKSPDLSVTHFVDNLDIDGVHAKAQNMLDFGTLYRIGTIDELPADRTFRGAWDIDDADLNDGVAGEDTVITRIERLTLEASTLDAQVAEVTTMVNTLSAEADVTSAANDLEHLTDNARDIQDQLTEAQQQLDQLREILPLNARRDRNTTNTTES